MRYAIVTDLNRCMGCLSCSVACKMVHNVPIGSFYCKVLRIGPNPVNDGGNFPDVEMYFLPLMCQHCSEPACVAVCPTGASYKSADGTVLIDQEKCSGCKLCLDACPYDSRFYNEQMNLVEKCTMCNDLVAQGMEPACVSECCGRARAFGDLDDPGSAASKMLGSGGENIFSLADSGNHPAFRYILRKVRWRGFPYNPSSKEYPEP